MLLHSRPILRRAGFVKAKEKYCDDIKQPEKHSRLVREIYNFFFGVPACKIRCQVCLKRFCSISYCLGTENNPAEPNKEELSLLNRVQTQCKSGVAVHRLLLARKIPQLVEQIGFEDSSVHMIPILDEMTDDVENGVRQSLCEQLAALGLYFKKHGPVGYNLIKSDLLRLSEKLLLDGATNVRDAALLITLEIAKLLDREDVISCVLPIVERLADSVDQEDYRVSATVLLNNLAPMMSQDQVLSFTISIMKKFSEDQMFRVRKGVASNVDLICQVLEQEHVTNLFLPIYLELSEDEIWGVRKACCDSLVAFSKYVTPEQRVAQLVPMFDRLANDSSRWVKSAALLSLGPFIATFKGSEVSPSLLEHYKSMNTTEEQNASLGESDHVTNCAHNFPAVLDTIGSARWDELKDIYFDLIKNQNVKVRRTLAFSLHAVASILGEKLTEEILCPTFEAFFTDLDEVKIGVIKNMSKFLQVLSLPVRKNYLGKLQDFHTTTGKNNWRQRKSIARQMGSLATLYDPETVGTIFLPILKKFLADPVASVRTALLDQKFLAGPVASVRTSRSKILADPVASVRDALLDQIATMVKCVIPIESAHQELLEHLQSFAKEDSNVQKKIWFCKVCPYLAKEIDHNIFDKYFISSLVELSNDKIVNTRIFVSEATYQIAGLEAYNSHEKLKESLQKLISDKNRDVALNAGFKPEQES